MTAFPSSKKQPTINPPTHREKNNNNRTTPLGASLPSSSPTTYHLPPPPSISSSKTLASLFLATQNVRPSVKGIPFDRGTPQSSLSRSKEHSPAPHVIVFAILLLNAR
ncbi:hypothetical protein M430DRAFT_249557 [Amorphotheca resinae ATCC 22711]|uniref:Uncharacterized protein n=1 Tax=Amorphotheca resinae ATCC 22711 TaxID=857342 RepID=A0A2T3B0E4_AMORE|nr:hypothetical protein M430DRAFT_249557 [Amorphotheca resinae ATCC 22711]PSS16864.1 hypothetical protein M430DRAFT_249557 [Amorphotheca resinae ATCC 22711]